MSNNTENDMSMVDEDAASDTEYNHQDNQDLAFAGTKKLVLVREIV